MDDRKKNKVKQNRLNTCQKLKVGFILEKWDPEHLATLSPTELASILTGQLGFLLTRTNLNSIANGFGVKFRSSSKSG